MPRALANPGTARASRSRRTTGGALWFRVAVVGVLLAAAVSGGIMVASARTSRSSHVEREVAALLAGIPQEGQTLGSPTAPVTLQLFAELEDYSSDGWFLRDLPSIIGKLVRTNLLKIEYRAFKTNTIASETFVKQQAAALAAGAQNKLWNYACTFYYEQGKEYSPYVTETYLDNIAGQVPGLSSKRWNIDRNSDQRIEQVVEEDQQGRAAGIHVTPAYRIGRTDGALTNFTGSEGTTFAGQVHRTTWASAEDIAKAISKLH
jgi:protein-disulfide isomerase